VDNKAYDEMVELIY